MSLTPLVLSILAANLVLSQTERNTLSEVKTLGRSSTESIFALQIRQIRTTSEETPAASAGNNPNVFGTDVPSNFLEVPEEHFRAISPLHPIGKAVGEKIKTDQGRGNSKLLSALEGNFIDRKKSDYVNNLYEAENLVWENCFDIANADSINAKYDIEKSHNLETESMRKLGNMLNKRNSLATNDSAALKSWLEKYNILKNAKTDVPNILTEPSEALTTSSITTSTVQIIPITTSILNSYTEPINITLDIINEHNIQETDSINWYIPNDDDTKIKFGSLPRTQTYLISKFKLDEGFHPFSFMSKFFSVIYLFDYPVGLVKDIVKGKFTFPYSFLQSIKVESTFLVFVITFGIFALIIPLYLFILSLISLFSKSKCTDEIESGTLFLEAERPDCHDKILVIFTFFFLLICCALTSGMVLSNEQSRMAVAESRNVISCACADIASWLSTAAQELHQGLVPPVDMVLYAYNEDLRNVATLLGQPIQQAIASESGIDLVLDSLADIITESEDIYEKVSSLRESCHKASLLATAAEEKIKDLAQQLDSLRNHCVEKDAPLCDTLRTNTLNIMMKFDSVLQENQLLELKKLGVTNLTDAISRARKEFRTLPSAISLQTERIRENILHDIENRRQIVHNSAKILNDIVRYLTAELHSFARNMDTGLDRLNKYELWRWVTILACNVIIGFVLFLILLALCCGCGNAKIHAKRTLQVSSFCLCIVSIILWSIVSATFLISGHAEVYACQILWDGQYQTLSTLLDRPSPLLSNNEGIFDVLFRDLHNVTIDVPIKNVLRECEKNEPAYIVFQLDKVLDVNKETSYFEWDELQDDLRRLSKSIHVGFLKTISDNFNKLLNQILVISDVNLTKYRMEYNGPVVGKDLPSFVDQLENVAVQVSDLSTAGRLETLATRTQRIHLSNIKPLEQLRTELVFKLTELELQMMPFRRKLNISLSHIHTAQFYIDNQGEVIAQKKLSTFISRLVSHTAGWRTHVLTTAGEHAGRCGPLFAVFAAIRTLVCTKYVSSLHGWWFCGFLLGVIWFTVFTPLCVKLWRSYASRLRTMDTLTLTNIGNPGHQRQQPAMIATGIHQDPHRHQETTAGDYQFSYAESGSNLDYMSNVSDNVDPVLPTSTKFYDKDYNYYD